MTTKTFVEHNTGNPLTLAVNQANSLVSTDDDGNINARLKLVSMTTTELASYVVPVDVLVIEKNNSTDVPVNLITGDGTTTGGTHKIAWTAI